jgi:histidinol dehydrogenase
LRSARGPSRGDGRGARGRRHQPLRVGGAHAIAALAYGTESIARVDKIVGSGNRYVGGRARSGRLRHRLYAGPTEIVIVAGSGRAGGGRRPVAQAEHDPDAFDLHHVEATRRARQPRVVRPLPGAEIVQQSISANSSPDWRR